ncbi:thioester domain-containing protein [Salinactinospora qingdaonensis]|uniref:Gram-positive cocci surface proteins LPxTG domain-containing protein n=1 Tax=Salinactinospora qingdaonensis TaxID=702744 RepID=A0ABP7GGR9_9ACTN
MAALSPRSGRRARAALALVAASLTAAGTITPGTAAAAQQNIARVDDNGIAGEVVHFAGEGDTAASTTLFNLRLDGDSAVGAYCVDISSEVDHEAAYIEAAWEDAPEEGGFLEYAAEVNWVLRHSYPSLGLDRLRTRAGIPSLDTEQAIAGTQAAIWHFSNGVSLPDPGGEGPAASLEPGERRGRANSAEVRALYSYLTETAESTSEPAPSLTVEPERVSGTGASPLGPLTVRTTSAEPVQVSVSGAESAVIVDGSGTPVSVVRAGQEFFLRLEDEVPAGAAKVYAQAAKAKVEAGRLFIGKDGVSTQPLVAAERGTVAATASATVTWDLASASPSVAASPSAEAATESEAGPSRPEAATTPGPEPSSSSPVVIANDKQPERDLPLTGTWVGAIIIAGVTLVTAGVAALVLARRRRRN